MVVVSTKNTRTRNTLAQQPAFHVFFILCFITLITLTYLYSDSALPLSSTSDFLVDNTVDKIQPLPRHDIIKQSALSLSSTSDLIADNAGKEHLPLPPHDIPKQSALPLTTTSDLIADNAVEELLPLEPNVVTKHGKQRVQNCPKEIDGLDFIKQRHKRGLEVRKQRLEGKPAPWDFPWQQSGRFLNDKWGFYVFCKANGFRVPEIYMCSTDGPKTLKDWREPAGLGFVVKIKDGYKSRGVYLMESGFGGREQISGHNMTREMVMEKMQKVENRNQPVGNLHAEELLKGPTAGIAPPDYKFNVANGEILYVAIIHNRGTDLECSALFNEQFDRVDEHGCFGWSAEYKPPKPGKCSVSTKDRRGPVAEYARCGDFARPKEWDELVAMAKKFSRIIGIYVRIDMYMHEGEIVMGEATFLQMLGKYHCFSKLDENGCIDPCLMGRFWKRQNDAFNNTQGGPITPEPASFKGWEQLSSKEKCERVMEASSSTRSLPSTN
jgi:hypothetical protein